MFFGSWIQDQVLPAEKKEFKTMFFKILRDGQLPGLLFCFHTLLLEFIRFFP
jgi:hypothetical protein